MAFSTILFDLDHTLLDTDTSEALAFEQMMLTIGVEEPLVHLDTYQEINQGLWRRVETGELTPNDVSSIRFTRLIEVLDLDADPEEMSHLYRTGLGQLGELYPGAVELLEALSDRQLGLVTNGIGQVQRDRLQRLDLDRFFGGVAISGEIGVAKPDPAIFDHLGFGALDPGTTIMIGDSLVSDIAAGTNAGFTTCWYNPNNAEIRGPNAPTITVESLGEIPAVVG